MRRIVGRGESARLGIWDMLWAVPTVPESSCLFEGGMINMCSVDMLRRQTRQFLCHMTNLVVYFGAR